MPEGKRHEEVATLYTVILLAFEEALAPGDPPAPRTELT